MDETLNRLRIQLELQSWPAVYLFKFIVPNNSETIAKVNTLFNEMSQVTMHESRNGKYISISAKELMLDVQSIIDKYILASKINGVISL
jgi:hypothetical protein